MSKGEKRDVAIYLKMVNKMRPELLAAEGNRADFRKRVTDGFKKAGVVIGAALVAGLTAAIISGATFEQSMANVGAVTNATTEQMAALEAQARSMGATTAFSASDASGAMYSLASAGLSTNQIIGSSEAVLKLAGATMSDMGQTAELVTSSMKEFGLAAEDSTRIANALAAGTQVSMLTMDRLANAMKYAGSIAPTVNMSLEQTVAAMGLMVDRGLDASQAGTGFRSMMIQLLNPSADLAKVLGGVTVQTDGLGAVITKLGQVSATELPKLFQAESFSAVNALVKAGADAFENMTDKVTGTNAAFEMYDRQMKTVKSRFAILKSAVQEDLIAVFEEIRPALLRALSAATAFAERIKPTMQRVAADLAKAFRELWAVLAAVFGFISQHINTILAFGAAIGAAVGVVYGIAVALQVAAVAMKLFTAVSSLNPVVLILSLIAGGIAFAIVKMGGFHASWIKVSYYSKIAWEDIKTFFAKMWAEIKSAPAYFDALGKTISEFARRMTEAFTDSFRKIGTLLGDIGKMLANPFKIKETWGQFKADLESGLTDAFDGMGDAIAGYWADAGAKSKVEIDSLTAQNDAAIETLKNQRRKLLDDLQKDSAGGATGGAAVPAGGPTPQEFQSVVAAYNSTMEPLKQKIMSFWFGYGQAAKDAGRDAKLAIRDTANSLIDLGNFTRYASGSIKSSVADMFNSMADGIGAAVNDSSKKLIDLSALAKNVFGSILSGLAKFAIASGLSSLGPWGAGIAAMMGFEKKASGGSFYGGRPYLVGEYGPELAIPGASGSIVSNADLKRLTGSGGGDSTTVNVTIPSGSLVFANDNMAIRRLGETIVKVIDTRVRRTFKE